MPKKERPIGMIPAWAMEGPVTLKNYDLRAEHYGVKLKQWKDNWPFLSRNPDVAGTAQQEPWEQYFRSHLGGLPPTFKLYLDGVIEYLSVPEVRPELFDRTYQPRTIVGVAVAEPHQEFTAGHRDRMTARFEQLLDDLRNGRLKHLGRFKDSGEQGPAPVGTVFNNYDEAVRRHGRPFNLLERSDAKAKVKPTVRKWQEEDVRAVRDRLGISEDQWDAIPDA